MKILMVDDDEAILNSADLILRRLGHTTVRAVDASQVLPTAQRESPDLILLDIGLPGGRGSDLIQKLKRSTLTSGIPVIVVSGSQEPGIREFVEGQGAEGFIEKPWNAEGFGDALKSMTPYLRW